MPQHLRLIIAWITVAIFLLFGNKWLGDQMSGALATVLFVWLFATMVWSAFGAIKVADKLAAILGEPLGSLVLTLTIIGLEGVLIGIAILTSDSGATMGRDTLLGANMIMINLAGGLALLLGGMRHVEQSYNFQGTSAYAQGTYTGPEALDLLLGALPGKAVILEGHTSSRNVSGLDINWETEHGFDSRIWSFCGEPVSRKSSPSIRPSTST